MNKHIRIQKFFIINNEIRIIIILNIILDGR